MLLKKKNYGIIEVNKMEIKNVKEIKELIRKEYNKSQLIEDDVMSRRQYEAFLRQLLQELK